MRTGPTGDADHGALQLATLVRGQSPFFFARVGDGAIECIDSQLTSACTCDGEKYTEELRGRLWNAIKGLRYMSRSVVWGDWATAVAGSPPRYVPRWDSLFIDPVFSDRLVNYESLLLMRKTEALVDFYRAVKDDDRKKVFVGSPWVARDAAYMLGATAITVPGDPWKLAGAGEEIVSQIERECADVVLFGAGLEGFSAIAKWWVDQGCAETCIHIGSALDPLFKTKTRSNQLHKHEAHALFAPLLGKA